MGRDDRSAIRVAAVAEAMLAIPRVLIRESGSLPDVREAFVP
jgi:hypothetical protein